MNKNEIELEEKELELKDYSWVDKNGKEYATEEEYYEAIKEADNN